MKIRSIRKNQAISPFGLGGIFDFQGESFVHMDIDRWPARPVIHLKRLEQALRVDHFRSPPVPDQPHRAPENQKVRFKRFPSWHFCPLPKCRRMFKLNWSNEQPGEPPKCPDCRKSTLVPMRFVSVCEDGHLDDVDWRWWVHVGQQGQNCQTLNRLKFISKQSRGTGLGALFIRCEACKRERSLDGLTMKDAMKKIGVGCRGRHPWSRQSSECEKVPQVVQRGASNAYFPVTASALDIPLTNMEDQSLVDDNIRVNACFGALKALYESVDNGKDVREDPMLMILVKRVAAEVACSEDDVIRVLIGGDEAAAEEAVPKYDEQQILKDEWAALTGNPPKTVNFSKTDIYRDGDTVEDLGAAGAAVLELTGQLSAITRVREVRALRGFERLIPSGGSIVECRERSRTWVPALEVFGEGIFLALSEEKLVAWEKKNSAFLAPRMKHSKEAWAESYQNTYLPEPSARFILLHTLSHLLMRQIVFECGYSSSSLRERIYSSLPGSKLGPMAGILIYTADSDSEGALGGLVDQGRLETFIPNLINSLFGAEWCSNDPICSEIDGQGLAGLNRAACHACSLVTETSCVYSNTLLDRTLLLGSRSPGSGFTGCFEPVLEAAREDATT